MAQGGKNIEWRKMTYKWGLFLTWQPSMLPTTFLYAADPPSFWKPAETSASPSKGKFDDPSAQSQYGLCNPVDNVADRGLGHVKGPGHNTGLGSRVDIRTQPILSLKSLQKKQQKKKRKGKKSDFRVYSARCNVLAPQATSLLEDQFNFFSRFSSLGRNDGVEEGPDKDSLSRDPRREGSYLQQLLVIEEGVPWKWSQDKLDPDPLCIEEELWPNQDVKRVEKVQMTTGHMGQV
ncbi:uncharacterized protein LOC121640290 [Melanotaenia boesemani]|uniref:uncharacterized protein LOC121640290 n=1 Tax=Melanotaenia boesemani TaxID=1250792 RepID=UPI001C05CEFD|nr:uncharacterized protein LOC121640290 [Melanotaenia boesemani]